MDRFEWFTANENTEDIVAQQSGIRLYNGSAKTAFDNGIASLTTHRLIWRDSGDPLFKISLHLSYVVSLDEQASGLAKSAKIVVHVGPRVQNSPAGPFPPSQENIIRMSFRGSGMKDFYRSFNEVLTLKKWQNTQKILGRQKVGIMGIERSIQQKQKAADRNIDKAFEDLGNLMEKAKEMVAISKNIAQKIKDKQGEMTQDETVMFKQYLLSMGIPDPVTRETHGTGAKYYSELAKQLVQILLKPLEEIGGTMTLTDIYCRVNRARGMELLSPDDLLNACKMLDILQLPITMREFDSGVIVLQLRSHSESKVIEETTQLIEKSNCLTAQELAGLIGLSVLLAKERLLLAEKHGRICRDDSVEGLKFYPNLFLSKQLTYT